MIPDEPTPGTEPGDTPGTQPGEGEGGGGGGPDPVLPGNPPPKK